MDNYQLKLHSQLLGIEKLIKKIKDKNKAGQYGDFSSSSECPKIDLVFDIGEVIHQFEELGKSVRKGELDG